MANMEGKEDGIVKAGTDLVANLTEVCELSRAAGVKARPVDVVVGKERELEVESFDEGVVKRDVGSGPGAKEADDAVHDVAGKVVSMEEGGKVQSGEVSGTVEQRVPANDVKELIQGRDNVRKMVGGCLSGDMIAIELVRPEPCVSAVDDR